MLVDGVEDKTDEPNMFLFGIVHVMLAEDEEGWVSLDWANFLNPKKLNLDLAIFFFFVLIVFPIQGLQS